MPPASLPTLEQHLEARLLELEKLHRARPNLYTAMGRAEAGERIDRLLDEIAEIQRMIDTTPAETLEDAAVKLRRLGAYVERGQPARLLAGALSAVERAAVKTSRMTALFVQHPGHSAPRYLRHRAYYGRRFRQPSAFSTPGTPARRGRCP